MGIFVSDGTSILKPQDYQDLISNSNSDVKLKLKRSYAHININPIWHKKDKDEDQA